MISRKKFLATSATASLVLTQGLSAEKSENEKTNVVIIHVDDLGWRDLACMGSKVYETPHIDKLAKNGMMFTSAYAAASICTPSRACMLTGSQPSRHGVYTVVRNRGKKTNWKVTPLKNNQFLPKKYPTIATVLNKSGIKSGAIGKWHLSLHPQQYGFDEAKWGGYLGLPINYFSPFALPFLPKDVKKGEYLPEYIRKSGVEFIEKHKDEHFFLYYSTYLPHDEIKNEGEDSTLDAPAKIVEKYKKKMETMKKAGQDLLGHDNPVYAAMIEETDRSVGVIIDKLEELKLSEKTLVLFISDNGGLSKYTSQLPLRGEKCTLYEGGIRVPMIALQPGKIKKNIVSDEPVSGIDFYPTICNLMGVEATDKKLVDGEDLSQLLYKGESLGERNLFWNFPVYNRPSDISKCPRSVMRRGKWKIHHRYEDNGYELYDLENDIGESENLVAKQPKVFEMMKKELLKTYHRFEAVSSLPDNAKYDAKATSALRFKEVKKVQPKKKSATSYFKEINLKLNSI